MQTTFRTDRLSIELLHTQDHAFIRELVNSEGWLKFIGERNVHSEEEATRYIEKVTSSPSIIYWVVRLKSTSTAVGIVSLIKRQYLEHFDIGFAFLPQYHGFGYAYEATKEVLLRLRKNPQYHTLLATTVPHNMASIQLLSKLDFHFLREMEVEGSKLHIYSNSIME